MNPKEQEIAINELEDRVDRLRNIYEQYFLGFERLEPTVPRKDVDRRFAILRKEQIRNTAMRFRFNVITQKYNTYSMHWVRICRQIEEGTYKRHVRRAKARFGDGPSGSSGNERDLSIDIDITEFDMDAALDEINAENAPREHHPLDTPPPPPPVRAAASARAIFATPGSSFAVAGRTRNDLERTTETAGVNLMNAGVHGGSERAARGATLPPGTKPRMIARKRDEAEPTPSSVRVPAALPRPSPSSAGRIVVPPPAASSGRIPSAGPAAVGRIPVAQPAAAGGSPSPSAGHPPSGGHQHVAAKGAPERPQIRQVGSVNRIPIAPAASAPRVSAPSPQPPPPSAARVPAAPPASAPRVATGSSPKLPGPRPPAPSFVDKDADPEAPAIRPGTRPRIPLPLPSQTRLPTKKE